MVVPAHSLVAPRGAMGGPWSLATYYRRNCIFVFPRFSCCGLIYSSLVLCRVSLMCALILVVVAFHPPVVFVSIILVVIFSGCLCSLFSMLNRFFCDGSYECVVVHARMHIECVCKRFWTGSKLLGYWFYSLIIFHMCCVHLISDVKTV